MSKLCSETFDGPFQWFEALKKDASERNYLKELFIRKSQLVDGGQRKHCMLVANCNEKIVGINCIYATVFKYF